MKSDITRLDPLRPLTYKYLVAKDIKIVIFIN